MARIPGPESFAPRSASVSDPGIRVRLQPGEGEALADAFQVISKTAFAFQQQADKNRASKALIAAQGELDALEMEITAGDHTDAMARYQKGSQAILKRIQSDLGGRVFPLISDRLGLAVRRGRLSVNKFFRQRVREEAEATFHADLTSIRKEVTSLSGPEAGLEFDMMMREAQERADDAVMTGAVTADDARKSMEALRTGASEDILRNAVRGRVQGDEGYYATIKALEAGDLGDDYLNRRLDSLTPEDREKLIGSVISEARRMKQFERDRESARDKALEDARRIKWNDYFDALDANDLGAARSVLDELETLEEDPFVLHEKGHGPLEGGGTGAFRGYSIADEPGVEAEARRRLLNGDIGRSDLLVYRDLLTPKTFSGLEGFADTVLRRTVADSMREISRSLGLPPNVQFTGDAEDELFRLSTKVNKAQSRLQRFVEEHPDAPPDRIVEERDSIIAEAGEEVDRDMAKEAKQILERRCQRVRGCDPTRPAESLQELIRKNEVVPEMVPGIMRAIEEARRRGVLNDRPSSGRLESSGPGEVSGRIR